MSPQQTDALYRMMMGKLGEPGVGKADRARLKEVFLASLQELPDRRQELLRLVFIEKLDRDEICRRFDLHPAELRVLIHRTLFRINELLGDPLQYKAKVARQLEESKNAAERLKRAFQDATMMFAAGITCPQCGNHGNNSTKFRLLNGGRGPWFVCQKCGTKTYASDMDQYGVNGDWNSR